VFGELLKFIYFGLCEDEKENNDSIMFLTFGIFQESIKDVDTACDSWRSEPTLNHHKSFSFIQGLLNAS